MQNYILLFHLSQLALNNILSSIISQISPFLSSIPKNTHTIYNILPANPPIPVINSLRNNKIIFLEQITTADNKNILTWNNIYLHKNKPNKECQPKWFNQILQLRSEE